MNPIIYRFLFMAALFVAVSACNGGGGNGNGTPNNDPGKNDRFTIGGNVSGMVGSGLVLQNNGGDDVKITGSGSFTFATPLPDGSRYQVTVAVMPDTLSCNVNAAEGSVSGENVTGVSIHCVYNGPGDPESRNGRQINEARGSCDGVLDYADELKPRQVMLVRQMDLGDGMAEVEFAMQLANQGDARYRSASVSINPAQNPFGMLAGAALLPAEFGQIGPKETVATSATLQLQLPVANISAVAQGIENGSLPMVVHADEEPVYPPGTLIRTWTAFQDTISRENNGNALLPDEPASDEPGAVHWIEFDVTKLNNWQPGFGDVATYAGDAAAGDYPEFDFNEAFPGTRSPPPDECLIIDDNTPVYITPGHATLWSIPRWLHYVRLRSVCSINILGGGVGFGLWIERTTHAELPKVVKTASFCYGRGEEIGRPVAATRLHEIDGNTVPDEVRDGKGQPIRFNLLPNWAAGKLEISGQVGCDTLRPQVSFRIRNGRVLSGFGFDSACSMTTEMRVREDLQVDPTQEPVQLWSHCMALPPIPLGTTSIPVTLQLKHLLDVSAGASAGAVVGFTKRWDSGFSVSCDAGAGGAAVCSHESHRYPTPVEFTPPQLGDSTNVSLQAKTTFQAAMRMGFAYPLCDLGAGISMEAGAYAQTAITPAQDPWWKVNYGLDLTAGVDFGLFALGLVNVQTDLFNVEDGIDAKGPLAVAATAAATAHLTGDDQRWAVAIDDTAVANGVDVTDIAALPDGASMAIASEAIGGRSVLVKLDRFGALQWVKRHEIGKTVRRVHALPDGTVIVAASHAYLSRHDADGNVLWSFDGEVGRPDSNLGRCSLRDVAVFERSPGVYDYVVIGIMGQATAAGSTDGCAFRVNADGSVAWAKVYNEADLQYFSGATATRDGNIAVVGEAYGNLKGNRRFPLVAKLNAASGAVIWWRELPLMRLGRLNAVAESEDGTFYAVGTAQRNISQTGAALLAKIQGDGSHATHVMLFQDFDWENKFNFDVFAPLTAGESAYDEFFDIEPMGDGFVIAGRTGLGVNTEAWVARINKQLGVDWYRTFDGSSTDSLGGVSVAVDGIFVSGYSGSLPEPDGPNTGENQLWVMKLPFTGAIELVPEAGISTRYLASGVRFSSNDPAVTDGAQAVAGPAGISVADAVVLSSAPNPDAVLETTSYCALPLAETGHISTLDSCADL